MRSKREAKRRALLDLLDRIPVRARETALVQKPAGSALPVPQQVDIPVPAKAPPRQPLQNK